MEELKLLHECGACGVAQTYADGTCVVEADNKIVGPAGDAKMPKFHKEGLVWDHVLGLLQINEETEGLQASDMPMLEGLDQTGGFGEAFLEVVEGGLRGAES